MDLAGKKKALKTRRARGRPTLEDAVEFFNLVQGLRLTAEEKGELVAFLRQL